ncbi:hypothetical protein FRB95_013429 [Tulasnella sp. JGI-2019a]|nr:hypothetical protein FRB95_013429 [Tulasnella sp. JGI-2019a]
MSYLRSVIINNHLKQNNCVPEVKKSLNNGDLDPCGTAVIVSTVFALVEATLITVIKAQGLSVGSVTSAAAIRLFRILAYIGLMLNASTVFSALLLIDRREKLNSASVEKSQPCGSSDRQLLECYGASTWVWDMVTFHYFATLGGGLSILGQLLMVVWVYQGHAAATCAVSYQWFTHI